MIGKYRTWDRSWKPTGFAATPQYAGQQPVRFPLDWTPGECFLAAQREKHNAAK